MTYSAHSDYCPFLMEGWQYKVTIAISLLALPKRYRTFTPSL